MSNPKFVDIAFFTINIPVDALTYKIPNDINVTKDIIGSIVIAEVRSRKNYGIVLNIHDNYTGTSEVKYIDKITDITKASKESLDTIKEISDFTLKTISEVIYQLVPNINKTSKSELIRLKTIANTHLCKSNIFKNHFIKIACCGSIVERAEFYSSIINCVSDLGNIIIITDTQDNANQIAEKVSCLCSEKNIILINNSNKSLLWEESENISNTIIISIAYYITVYPIKNIKVIILDNSTKECYKDIMHLMHAFDCALLRASVSNCMFISGTEYPDMYTDCNYKDNFYNLSKLNNRTNISFDCDSNHSIMNSSIIFNIEETIKNGDNALIIYNSCSYGIIESQNFKCKNCGQLQLLIKDKDLLKIICKNCNKTFGFNDSTENIKKFFGIDDIKEFIESKIQDIKICTISSNTKESEVSNIFKKYKNKKCNVIVGTNKVLQLISEPSTKFIYFIYPDKNLLDKNPRKDLLALDRFCNILRYIFFKNKNNINNQKIILKINKESIEQLDSKISKENININEDELKGRKDLNWPPYGRCVKISYKNQSKDTCKKFIKIIEDIKYKYSEYCSILPGYAINELSIRNKKNKVIFYTELFITIKNDKLGIMKIINNKIKENNLKENLICDININSII